MPLDRRATADDRDEQSNVFGEQAPTGLGDRRFARRLMLYAVARDRQGLKRSIKLRMVILTTVPGSVKVCPVRGAFPSSLDHLVGEREQCRRHVKTKGSSRPDIDGQFEFGRCLRR